MKILLIDNAKGWGGAEEQFLALAKGLVAAGHSVTLALRAGSTSVKRLSGEQLTIWAVPRGGLKGVVAMLHYAAAAKREQFQVVHVHRDHDLPAGKLYALAAGARLILTQHCRPTSPGRLMYALADRIVSVSEYIASDLRERLPSLASRISVIHNGINLSAFADPDPTYWKRNLTVGESWPLLGVVGCFYKNQGELIELLPELRKEFPDVKLLLIGEDEQKKPPLVNKAAVLGVSDAVVFTGNVPREQMKNALAGLDLQLSAFRCEGFGLAVVEGMAVGTPFVGYRAGGYPEIVVNGTNGYLVEEQGELLKTIVSLLRDRQLLNTVGGSCCSCVRERFSIESMLNEYDSLYSELIKS